MSRGYFTIAQGTEYQRMAYALALSLKISQPADLNRLSIGVPKDEILHINPKYLDVFDEVVEIPWGDAASNSSWKLENEWKTIYMTPYDETVKLDADMLFLQDISAWWNILTESPGVFATNVKTYKGETVTSDYCRKTVTESQLPNIYTAFFYFKKNDVNYELFKLAEFIFNNWQRCFYEYLGQQYRPKYVSTDIVFAIAAKILDYCSLNKYPHIEIPTFVHMKSQLQNITLNDSSFMNDSWTKMIPYYFNKRCELKIGNFRQVLPFHYQDKTFLTDQVINTLEKKLGV